MAAVLNNSPHCHPSGYFPPTRGYPSPMAGSPMHTGFTQAMAPGQQQMAPDPVQVYGPTFPAGAGTAVQPVGVYNPLAPPMNPHTTSGSPIPGQPTQLLHRVQATAPPPTFSVQPVSPMNRGIAVGPASQYAPTTTPSQQPCPVIRSNQYTLSAPGRSPRLSEAAFSISSAFPGFRG